MITRTIHNLSIATSNLIKDGMYKPLLSSTLNEKYDLRINVSEDNIPKINWYSLGLDYSKLSNLETIDLTKKIHSIKDYDVFIPIPFVIREASIGLNTIEEDLYKIKITKSINGILYILCYLKEIESLNILPEVHKLRKSNGSYAREDIISTDIQVPKDINDNSNEYMIVSSTAEVKLSDAELSELRNSTNILYPNEDNRFKIAEVGIYSGVEDGNELAIAQASFFKYIDFDFETNTEFSTKISLGSLAPLVKL